MNINQYDSYLDSSDWLEQRNLPVAITFTEVLEPAEGPDAVIFPPTYARRGGEHPYPISTLQPNLSAQEAQTQGKEANICDLDSVGSQANRMEGAFVQKPFNALVPQYAIACGETTVNLLEIGHRIADGAVRFSELSEEVAKAIRALRCDHNAAEMAKLAPTSLIFGFWDSRDSQFKYPRVVSSIIRATNVAVLKRSAQFNPAFDPSTLGMPENGENTPMVQDEKDAKDPLSQVGLRSAPSVDSHGGVRVFGTITRRTEINLIALRSIAAVKESKLLSEETLALRRYLLGLSLVAARVQNAYNLRQGCLLVRKSKTLSQQTVGPDGDRNDFSLEFEDAFSFAKAAAKNVGILAEEPKVAVKQFQTAKLEGALKGKAEEKAAKKAAKKK